MSLLALIACLAALIAATALTRRCLLPRAAMFLRVMLPSWRFFDHVEPAPQLLYRVFPDGAPPHPWEPMRLTSQRSLWALFVNPRGNLGLAYHTLLEQLADELAELAADDQAERLVSYELVASLVETQLLDRIRPARRGHYQFKLQSASGQPGPPAQDLLISKLHPLG